MTAQSQVPKLYHTVIDDVINNVREAFMDEGVDPSVLSELKQIWQNKLATSKVMENEVGAPPSAQNLLSGPYACLQQQQQQQHHSSNQQHQRSSGKAESASDRPPAIPASSVPVFTTLSHPGSELSDAASMAYSSILQSAIVQTPTGPMQIAPQPAHTGTSATAAAAAANRAALMAAAAQPQYLFAHPGGVAPVIIPHSQAIRLQQQQQSADSQSRSSGGSRGSKLPQVDGAAEERACNVDAKRSFESSSARSSSHKNLKWGESSSASTSLSSSFARGVLRLSTGESVSGRVINGTLPIDRKKSEIVGKAKGSAPSRSSRRKVEIVFQLDGADNSSSDEDDDEDDDNDLNDDDDDSDNNPDDEDVPGVEEEPLNSGDDVSDNDPEELFDTENVVVCQFERITRVRNKWRFYLKDGIMNIHGKDYVFLKASGEAEW